jgi:hypothetical protein
MCVSVEGIKFPPLVPNDPRFKEEGRRCEIAHSKDVSRDRGQALSLGRGHLPLGGFHGKFSDFKVAVVRERNLDCLIDGEDGRQDGGGPGAHKGCIYQAQERAADETSYVRLHESSRIEQ